MKRRIFDKHKFGLLVQVEQIIALFVILIIIFRFVIGFSIVSGESMHPTFEEGSFVAYTRIGSTYEVGDVVSVKMPSGMYYIKRVVAKQGDTVEIYNGSLYINGNREEGDYINGYTETQDEGIMEYPYTLEEGEYFVCGDNRKVSVDSRTFGPVGKHQIKGKVWSRFDPYSQKK